MAGAAGADERVRPEGAIVRYRVEPDVDEPAAEWHVLTFENGVEIHIYTMQPIVVVDVDPN